MKRKIAFILTAAWMFGLTACGAANEPDHTSNLSAQTESSQVVESSSVQDSQDNVEDSIENSIENVDNTERAESGKVLIAYFAVAENSDVDAISSASVTEVDGEAKGLVRIIAEDIQAVTVLALWRL